MTVDELECDLIAELPEREALSPLDGGGRNNRNRNNTNVAVSLNVARIDQTAVAIAGFGGMGGN